MICEFNNETLLSELLIELECRAYTVKIQVGTKNQEVSLQVDTGSSDLVCKMLSFLIILFI